MTSHEQPGATPGDQSALHERPDIWGPRLLRILGEQVSHFEQLDELSVAQGELINTGRSDELLALLSRRQVLVDRITDINTELEPFLSQWRTLAPALPDALSQEIGQTMGTIDRLVEKITARDDADKTTLDQRRGAIQQELGSVARGRNAVAAYASTGTTQPPRFQDRNG